MPEKIIISSKSGWFSECIWHSERVSSLVVTGMIVSMTIKKYLQVFKKTDLLRLPLINIKSISGIKLVKIKCIINLLILLFCTSRGNCCYCIVNC